MLRPLHPALRALEDVVADLSSGRDPRAGSPSPDQARDRAAALDALFAEGVVFLDGDTARLVDLVGELAVA